MGDDANKPGWLRRKVEAVAEHVIALAIFSPLAWFAAQLSQSVDRRWLFLTLLIAVSQAIVTWGFVRYSRRRIRREEVAKLRGEMEVTRSTFERTSTRIEEEHRAQLIQAAKATDGYFEKYSEEQHQFAHAARDLAVKMMGKAEIRNKNRNAPIVPDEFRPQLLLMLEHMAKTFKAILPPGTRVYAAIRERNRDKYFTLLRAGDVDSVEREKHTLPLHKKMKMVEELRDSFVKGDCVLRTGSLESTWQRLPNDERNEDLSVLLGAGFSKKWNQRTDKFEPIQLEWIVGVAANVRGSFNDTHKPLMKSFNDIFGLLLNVFLRYSDTGSDTTRFFNREKPSESGGSDSTDVPQRDEGT